MCYLQSVLEAVKISAFVDIHAFGQEVNYPWTGASEHTPHENDLHKVATDMSKVYSYILILHYYIIKFVIFSALKPYGSQHRGLKLGWA